MASSVHFSDEDAAQTNASQRFPWVSVLWFSALLIALYAPVLWAMVKEWATDEEMGHGFFVPLVAGYIIWRKKDEILRLNIKPNWWGLVVIAWGFIQLIMGTVGADYFLARTSFLISLVGVLLVVGGTALVRSVAFPLFLLLFMIRIPSFIYGKITLPLQIFASKMATSCLSLLGIPVLREGNILELANQRLYVEEACSGIRSLLSLSFLSLVYAYFFDSKAWMRAVLLVAAIPIAIITNASRITITGVLSQYNSEWAQGIYHSFEGWVVFMLALVILVAAHQTLNRAYNFIHARR